jgi:hypothetical protein
MLLIDGVKYQEWKPQSEDEFEQIVKDHSQEIFGDNSIYVDIKHKIKSEAGIGSIPDGYVIMLGDIPRWNVIEVELASHNPYDHIISQIGRFIKGIKNPLSQQEMTRTIYNEINKDTILANTARKVITPRELHDFISDCILKPPEITIVIEEKTKELDEAIETLAYRPTVIEFRTFTSKRIDKTVHAHLFKPLYSTSDVVVDSSKNNKDNIHISDGNIFKKAGKVTLKELVDAGLIKDKQVLCFFHTRVFEGERAQIITSLNALLYQSEGRQYSKSELAKKLLIKHGFKHDDHGVAGPKYWVTEDGKLLSELEDQIRIKRGDRK